MDVLELLLLSVALGGGYQGLFFLRRGGPSLRSYAFMMMVDAVLALMAFLARRSEGPSRVTDMVGWVAVGAFICLVLVAPSIRRLARALVKRDRVRWATLLFDLCELLQPGLGARQEAEFAATLSEMRAGRVEGALAALRSRRASEVQPMVRRVIDERIVLFLLFARRWREATLEYERTLEGQSGYLRPQLHVEVLRAYAETGSLERSAALLEELERSPVASEPALAPMAARARMIYLAFAGRPVDVELILQGPLGQLMPPLAKDYWVSVARCWAGDCTGARSALARAEKAAGRDAEVRRIVDEQLAAIVQAEDQGALPRSLSPHLAELADRVALTARTVRPMSVRNVPRLVGVRMSEVPATVGLVFANVLVALLVYGVLGSTEDPSALVRAGANYRVAVRAGETWRLHASTFLHVGIPHLLVNMYGLWVLGRLMEQILGSSRFLVLYTLAGLGGAFASTQFGSAGISAGASGAIFGVLGAAIAELALHRQAYPNVWRQALLANLVFLALANLLIGAMYPHIDQHAHGGGFVVGLVVSWAVTPKGQMGKTRTMAGLCRVLLFLSFASAAYSAWSAVTTTYGDTVARVGFDRRTVAGVSVEVPRLWVSDEPNVLADPALGSRTLIIEKMPAHGETPDEVSTRILVDVAKGEPSVQESAPIASAPPEWSVRGLRLSAAPNGKERSYRISVFSTVRGRDALSLMFVVPEKYLAELRPIVSRVMSSVAW